MDAQQDTQRIARLTPLDDVLTRIPALVNPVEPRALAIASARGRTLAADIVAAPYPAMAVALRDGWAVKAEATADAGAYAPAPLPAATLVDAGEAMPDGTDAVAQFDEVIGRDGRYEALSPVASGSGVVAAETDIRAGSILRQAGERLRAVDVAVLAAAGIAQVMAREPRIRIVAVRAIGDAALAATRSLIGRVVVAAGGVVQPDGGDLVAALRDETTDAVIAIGGTGSGRGDASVHTLAQFGRVEVHGIAMSTGRTAAFGVAGTRPVLLVPGRVDAALATWLTLGQAMFMCLTGNTEPEFTRTIPLARKVASQAGMADVIPVRCRNGAAEPLASGYLPLQSIAQADGWILVPAGSEGYPAGAEVAVRPWP